LTEYLYTYFSQETNVEQIASVFDDTAAAFLQKVQTLRRDYNDGRLLKLIEDLVLSAVLKNNIPFDYVVGNPPWVAKQNTHSIAAQERRLKQQYLSAWKETDPYLQFIERGFGMLREGGTLGLVVSNRFLTNQGGEEIRGLLAKNRIAELVDFTDYPVFSNATNYSAILTAEKQVANDDWGSFVENGAFTNDHTITAARVRDWDGDVPGLVDQLYAREPTDSVDFYEINSQRFQERVWVRSGEVKTEEVRDSFDEGGKQDVPARQSLPQADIWPASPPEEYELVDRIESAMEMRLGNRSIVRENEPENAPNLVEDSIHEGIATSGDGAYVVYPEVGIDVEKLHEIERITVEPKNVDESFTVETALLKVDIMGSDAARWLPEWSGRLVFVPYIQGNDGAELITPTKLSRDHPRTWRYFTEPSVLKTLSDESTERQELHGRLAAEVGIIDEKGTKAAYRQIELTASQYRELSSSLRSDPESVLQMDNDLWWYRYMYPKNIRMLPESKMLTGNQRQHNELSFDDAGIMAPHNARVYAILASEDIKRALAGVLNSHAVEFYHKQHARIHQGKAYSYIKDYTSKWPVATGETGDQDELAERVDRILHLKDLEIKIPQFPDPYIAEAREEGGEFITLTHTPSSSYQASPSINSDLADGRVIQLKDGHIDDSIIDERQGQVAEYVREALDGRELERNEMESIPVPLDTRIADAALEELESDRDELAANDIGTIESDINDIVFGLYGIEDKGERAMIRRFNRQHEVIQPIGQSLDTGD